MPAILPVSGAQDPNRRTDQVEDDDLRIGAMDLIWLLVVPVLIAWMVRNLPVSRKDYDLD